MYVHRVRRIKIIATRLNEIHASGVGDIENNDVGRRRFLHCIVTLYINSSLGIAIGVSGLFIRVV